jgi:hypothetical protein
LSNLIQCSAMFCIPRALVFCRTWRATWEGNGEPSRPQCVHVFICFLPSIFVDFVGKNTDFGHTW